MRSRSTIWCLAVVAGLLAAESRGDVVRRTLGEIEVDAGGGDPASLEDENARENETSSSIRAGAPAVRQQGPVAKIRPKLVSPLRSSGAAIEIHSPPVTPVAPTSVRENALKAALVASGATIAGLRSSHPTMVDVTGRFPLEGQTAATERLAVGSGDRAQQQAAAEAIARASILKYGSAMGLQDGDSFVVRFVDLQPGSAAVVYDRRWKGLPILDASGTVTIADGTVARLKGAFGSVPAEIVALDTSGLISQQSAETAAISALKADTRLAEQLARIPPQHLVSVSELVVQYSEPHLTWKIAWKITLDERILGYDVCDVDARDAAAECIPTRGGIP